LLGGFVSNIGEVQKDVSGFVIFQKAKSPFGIPHTNFSDHHSILSLISWFDFQEAAEPSARRFPGGIDARLQCTESGANRASLRVATDPRAIAPPSSGFYAAACLIAASARADGNVPSSRHLHRQNPEGC
jgi:hypothetical protein